MVTTVPQPQIEVHYTEKGSRDRKTVTYDMDMLIDVKGWKATGNKLSAHNVKKVVLLNADAAKEVKATEEPKPVATPIEAAAEQTEAPAKPAAPRKPPVRASVSPLMSELQHQRQAPAEPAAPKPVESKPEASDSSAQAQAKPTEAKPEAAQPAPAPEKKQEGDDDDEYGVGDTIELF